MPLSADLKLADKLLADCAKLPADSEQQRKPLAALLSGTRMLALDAGRSQRIADLTKPIRSEYDAAVAKVLTLLGENADGFKKPFADLQRRWGGAMPAFFKDAEALAKLKRQVNAAIAAPPEQQGALAAPLRVQVAKAADTSTDPALLAQLDTMGEQLAALAPVEVKTGKPPKTTDKPKK